MVKYNDKWIHFGDKRHEHYRDSTPIKLYSYLDHNDPKRRESYRKRSRGIKNKDGKLTYLDKKGVIDRDGFSVWGKKKAAK